MQFESIRKYLLNKGGAYEEVSLGTRLPSMDPFQNMNYSP